MVSTINYRFKSYKEYSTITFEGNGIPLWELKHEIVTQRKMTSKDYALLFYDHETDEQIIDEYAQIPRNSCIIVHRIPGWMVKTPGAVKEKKVETAPVSKSYKEPPENYVCFRCGNKGHFIQHCPTNSDKNFDIVKIKKPSGIPKDFLERVEGTLEGPSAMLMVEDGFVKARPQTQEWKKSSAVQSIAAPSVRGSLRCSSCENLLRQPIITMCMHSYCDGCIEVGDRCVVCNEIVTHMMPDISKAKEIEQKLGG